MISWMLVGSFAPWAGFQLASLPSSRQAAVRIAEAITITPRAQRRLAIPQVSKIAARPFGRQGCAPWCRRVEEHPRVIAERPGGRR
jgi:hypothetical protein